MVVATAGHAPPRHRGRDETLVQLYSTQSEVR